MVNHPQDNSPSDDLLEDFGSLEGLLEPEEREPAPWPGESPAETDSAGEPANGQSQERPDEPPAATTPVSDTPAAAPPETAQTQSADQPDEAAATSGESPEEDIPVLDDVVHRGEESPQARPETEPEPPPQLPTQAEIDSWLELAIETRLEPFREQLRQELWEELLRRYPSLRESD